MKKDKSRYIIAVIPAKEGSNRLPHKNMILLNGEPLLYYTIKYAKESKMLDAVYVSTDSRQVAKFARKHGAAVILRPPELCGEAPLVKVYAHALTTLTKRIDYVVGLQPDHPDRTMPLDKILRYAITNNLDDLSTVAKDGSKNGSVKVFKATALQKQRVSIYSGSLMDDATNIHTIDDVRLAEIRMKQREREFRIKIDNKIISRQSPAFVIAEGACNHMCDMRLAKKMIDEAHLAGADAIKFQTYKAEKLVAKNAQTYWNYGSTHSQYEYYKKLDKFDKVEYKALLQYAQAKKIVVFSSPFDIESADMLNDLGMPLFKIASCLVPDKKLIQHIARFKKPIIISTGGSDISEIRECVQEVYSQGNYSLVIMACTLSYPAKNCDAHLLRIRTLHGLFPEAVIGYSDHTEPDTNMVIPSLAVSLGAKVIEKHFTLDRTLTGSGHSFSVDPPQLKKMVDNIRLAEEVVGKEEIVVLESEQKSRQSARMSIVARCRINKSRIINDTMLAFKRPGTGILPKFIDAVVGKTAKRNIEADEQLSWNDVG